MIFWYFNTTCDKDSDEPGQVYILKTALMAQVCQASDRLYAEWINFGSHDSNHNLEKRPFCI